MVRFKLLGELQLEIDGRDVELPASRKARLLLAMLVLERRAHGRSELAGRLWPDVREDSARASLRNALAQLRSALGRHADSVVRTEGGEAIAIADSVETDIAGVGRLLADGRAETAADACEAQLLPGFDDEWTYAQRDALTERLAGGLAAAATAAEAAGDVAAAIRLTRRLTALDRLAEVPHRDLMRRLAAHGDRAAAVATYERLRDRLTVELGIAPSPATRTLADNIRTDGGVAAAALVGPSIVRYAGCGGRSIAYQRFGRGTFDLLIVPGWASNLDAVWDFPPLGPLFTRLGEIARCTVFDKRGTGLSDRDLDFGSLETRADDIRAVMDATGLERATLFAYSESAALALVFAAAHPERVDGLVLYSAYACLIEEPGHYGGFEPEVVDAFLERIRSDWGAGTVSRVSFQGAPDTSAVRDLLARWERSVCTPTMAAHIIRANANIDIRPLLPTVRARALVLHSTGDPIAPPALGRFVAGQLPNATYVERDAAYHLPWEGSEAWFVDEVARFLTATDTRGQRTEPVLATVLAASGCSLDPDAVGRHGGQSIDATTALFASPSRALDCAATLAAPAGAGLHAGEVIPGEGGGAAVEIARGVAALAAPGELLVSRTVRDLTAGSARRFEERGRHTVTIVAPAEWEVFRYLP